MANQLKRQIKAFHELMRTHGIRSFTYVEYDDWFEVVADDQVDLNMIAALLETENVNGPTIH